MAVSAPVFVRQFLAVLDAFLPVSMICLISLITCEKFYTFAPQSRAFLSQLSVTGDESGFFYVLPQRYYNSHSIHTFPFVLSNYPDEVGAFVEVEGIDHVGAAVRKGQAE